MTPPTVLTVMPALPIPAVTGLQLRLLSILEVVRALGARSTALYFEQGAGPGDPSGLDELCESVRSAGPVRSYATFSVTERVGQRLDFCTNALRGRLGRHYPFSLPYDHADGERRVAEEAARVGADAVILPSFLGHYAPRLRAEGRAVIAEATDVLWIQSRNFLRRYGRRSPLRAPGLAANHLATRSLERLVLPQCDEIWANSEPQAAELRRIAPHTTVVVVGNVLDAARIEATPLPPAPVVGFIGNYAYTPNLDAARHLVEGVAPILRGRCATARVALAGGGLPDDLAQDWGARAAVDVLGRVPSSGAFFESCRVLAFALYFESGPPLKVVEALAHGRPAVVSPQIGAALGLRDGHDALVAADDAASAAAIGRLFEDDDLAGRLARNGRRTFEDRFSLEGAVAEARRLSMLSPERSAPDRVPAEGRSGR